MRMTVEAARRLAERTMAAVGHDVDEAAAIADHLIDCELRGLSYGGLPRALSLLPLVIAPGEDETSCWRHGLGVALMQRGDVGAVPPNSRRRRPGPLRRLQLPGDVGRPARSAW